MNSEEREFLRSLPYSRKPCRVIDVYDSIDYKNYNNSLQYTLTTLPFINSNKFLNDNDHDVDFFTDAFEKYLLKDDTERKIYHPQFWVTKIENEWFVINNEGFDYARYVVKIKNFPRINTENNTVNA